MDLDPSLIATRREAPKKAVDGRSVAETNREHLQGRVQLVIMFRKQLVWIKLNACGGDVQTPNISISVDEINEVVEFEISIRWIRNAKRYNVRWMRKKILGSGWEPVYGQDGAFGALRRRESPC